MMNSCYGETQEVLKINDDLQVKGVIQEPTI